MRAAAALVLALAACGSSKQQGPTCKTRVSELTAFLSTMEHEAQMVDTRQVALVERTDLPKTQMPYGPNVAVSSSDVRLNHQSVPLDELRDRLRALGDARAGAIPDPISGEEQPIAMLFVARDAPWERVVGVVQQVYEAGHTPLFVFAKPVTGKAPPRTKIDDELDALEARDNASDKATALADLIRRQVKSCPAAIRLFGEVASAEGGKAELIIDNMPGALFECDCAASPEIMASVLWRMLGTRVPLARAVLVELSRDAPVISAPATTTWAEASKRLTASTNRAWFVVAP